MRKALAFVLLICACSALAADDVRILERRTLPATPVPRDASHALTLYVYAFAGTSWRTEDIIAAVPLAAELLAQCAVAIERVEFAVLETPQRYRYFYTSDSRALVRALGTPRPAVFFVQDSRNEPAFDAEAVGLANSGRRPELANTAWIAHGIRDLPNALAHELVHVLADSGEHSRERGNLMRDETLPANTRLTPAQCARVRDRGEANGLLAPAKKS